VSADPTEVFLNHVLDSIRLIESYSTGLTKDEFERTAEKQDAIVRRLEVIGEAVKNLPPELRARYPQVPWRQIAGTRDKLIHQYFSIDLDLTWQIVQSDLPVLGREITRILADIRRSKP
jgi:uncharacterized protein with HEPN domain